MIPKSRRRRITTTLAALALALGAGTAFAALEGGVTITFELRIPDGDGGHYLGNDEQIEDTFNMAQCVCSTAEVGVEDREHTFVMRMKMEPFMAQTDQRVEIWYGNSCDTLDAENKLDECTEGEAINDVDDLQSLIDREIPIHEVMFPGNLSEGCVEQVGTENVYAMIDAENDGTYEDVFSSPVEYDSKRPPLPDDPIANPGESAIQLEWGPPVSNAEDVFKYQALCADATTDMPVFSEPTNDPAYDTGFNMCGEDDGLVVKTVGTSAGPVLDAGPGGPDASIADAGTGDGDGGTGDGGAGSPDAGVAVDLPQGLAELDPAFICGEASGTQTSLRISNLNNDNTYRVVLVPIDAAKNPNAIDLGLVTPKPVIDFWEDYHDQGGTVEGGFCLATSTYGGNHPFTNTLRDFRDDVLAQTAAGRWLTARYYDYVAPLGAIVESSIILRVLVGLWLLPFVLAAAFWLYAGIFIQLLVFAMLVLLRVRTRDGDSRARRRGVAAAFAACAVLAAAPLASAEEPVGGMGGDRYDPYWDSFDAPVEGAGPQPVRWLFGIKLGPYLPDVDSAFSGEGPYERMFGTDQSLMFAIDVDRYFMWPAGQFGVTGSIGYMGNSAKAFATDRDTMGNVVILETPDGLQRSNESTKFRLIPTNIGAVYRFTDLDDRFGVPLVPYGKASLAYYIWWITAPDGVAEVPDDDCPDLTQDCDGNKARGASLGIQLSLGLSIRAERIDKQSASSMRTEMGIEHAGFYAEVQYAKVDGFGSDKKLAVGDFTWFGGINFEF